MLMQISEALRIIKYSMGSAVYVPLDTTGISLNKQMYKVLVPSIMTPYKFLWTYGGSGYIYVSVAG